MSRRPTLALAFALALGSSAFAQEPDLVAKTDARTPAEEKASFRLPPGFEAQLVASEPTINKPMNLAFDDRGRLWVTTTVEYPFPAPAGKKGRDRVVILDDLGPDGRARKVTNFAEGLNIPIGLMPLGRGDSALVHAIPAISRLTDTDGDGKADKSEVVYSTFGSRDTHGMTNAFTWGFDGWIYACHGFTNVSKVAGKDGKPIVMQSGNTYRMKADGSHLEYNTHGQVNPFGLSFDPMGNLFSCDCHSRPLYCLLPGAWYPSFGTVHDGLGLGPEMISHDHGSTGISGIAVIAADHYPAEFRDNVVIGNVVTSRINRDKLAWTGATPKAIEQPDFLVSGDPWFRPVDIKLGPDGALYVADFYNKIIGHYEVPLTHPGRDRERGRIWRIVYTGKDASAKPLGKLDDASAMSTTGLVGDLGHPNLTRRMRAANVLVERNSLRISQVRKMRKMGVQVDGGGKPIPEIHAAAVSPEPLRRMHALWVLERLAMLERESLTRAAGDGHEVVRVHAMKILGDLASFGPEDSSLARRGLVDASQLVRRAAAEALAKHPATEHIKPLLDAIRLVPPGDTHLKHAERIALRDQLMPMDKWDDPRLAAGALSDLDRAGIADVAPGVPTPASAAYLTDYLLRNLPFDASTATYLRHIARYGAEADQAKLAAILAKGRSPSEKVAFLKAIHEGEQAHGAPLPAGVSAFANTLAGELLAGDEGKFGLGLDLIGALKLAEFRGPLGKAVAMTSLPAPRRMTAIAALAAIDAAGSVPILGKIAADASEPVAIRERAAAGLASANRPEAIAALLAVLPTAPGTLQTVIATGLAATPAGAESLLANIEAGKASARLLQERGVSVALDKRPNVKPRIALLLKGLPPAEQRIQGVIKARRTAFAKAPHDAVKGEAIFVKNCAACHQIGGKGVRIGPQLDGVGVRGPDRLLEDVLDPNRNVDQAFRSTTLTLKDGRVLSGLLLREEGQVLILADNLGKEVRTPRLDVDDRSTSQASPMPANWSDQISEPDFADLLAYLLAQKPKDVPARP